MAQGIIIGMNGRFSLFFRLLLGIAVAISQIQKPVSRLQEYETGTITQMSSPSTTMDLQGSSSFNLGSLGGGYGGGFGTSGFGGSGYYPNFGGVGGYGGCGGAGRYLGNRYYG